MQALEHSLILRHLHLHSFPWKHSLVLRHLHLHSFSWNLRVWPSLETCTSSVACASFFSRCDVQEDSSDIKEGSKMCWLTSYAAFENSKLWSSISLVMSCKASASSVRVPSPIRRSIRHTLEKEDRAFDSTKPVDRQK